MSNVETTPPGWTYDVFVATLLLGIVGIIVPIILAFVPLRAAWYEGTYPHPDVFLGTFLLIMGILNLVVSMYVLRNLRAGRK